jgi:arginine N-succinyltransferase
MILIREVKEADVEALERLGSVPGLFNLSGDRDALKEKILKSVASFSGKVRTLSDTKYIFIAEDLETGKAVGTSMIAGQHGTPDSPHFFFEVGSEQKFSEAISTGFIHGTLELKTDQNGPSEIGGLVIDPEYRNHSDRVGRQISFARFLFLSLNRNRFRDRVIAELLPPLNKKGQSPLWEAIGRRFTNMDYWEADQFCQKNKEFIFSLFPSGKIYTTFLSAEARNAIGKVSKDTEPVVHMLKKVGFKYVNQVDPFDGGPHFWAKTDDLKPLQGMVRGTLAKSASPLPGRDLTPLGLLASQAGPFKAVSVPAISSQSQILIDPRDWPSIEKGLKLEEGASVAWMPFY